MTLLLTNKYKYFGRHWYFTFLEQMFDNDSDNILNEFTNTCSSIAT